MQADEAGQDFDAVVVVVAEGILTNGDQPFPFLERHVLQGPALILPDEQEGLADEGGVKVGEAFEVELDAAGDEADGAAEDGLGLLVEEIVGLGGGLGEAEERVADAGVVITL